MSTQIGLALSGGGAKGLAHIGVLKVLEEAQIPVHLMAGTSMGGIVAAVYAAGHSAAEIEEIARSLRLLDIIQRDRTGMGLIGYGKIASRLRKALGGDLAFDQLKLPLALIAVDLQTGEEVIMRQGSVIEAMMATMAVPLLFPPVAWQNHLLVDGGLLNQVPFDVVRQMGAQRTIAVHAMRDLSGRPGEQATCNAHGAESLIRLLIQRSRWAPLFEIGERSYSIMSHRQVTCLLQQAPPDLMIEIMLHGVGLLDLDQIDVCLEAGDRAARQHLAELIELRDAPPGRLARWWRTTIKHLREQIQSQQCTTG